MSLRDIPLMEIIVKKCDSAGSQLKIFIAG